GGELMPIYAYFCQTCGPFERLRSMSESQTPQECPECESLSARMATAVNLNIMEGTRRKVHQLNEKNAHEPRIGSRGHPGNGHEAACDGGNGDVHGPGCGHGSGSSPHTSAGTKKGAQPTSSRPWQVGH